MSAMRRLPPRKQLQQQTRYQVSNGSSNSNDDNDNHDTVSQSNVDVKVSKRGHFQLQENATCDNNNIDDAGTCVSPSDSIGDGRYPMRRNRGILIASKRHPPIGTERLTKGSSNRRGRGRGRGRGGGSRGRAPSRTGTGTGDSSSGTRQNHNNKRTRTPTYNKGSKRSRRDDNDGGDDDGPYNYDYNAITPATLWEVRAIRGRKVMRGVICYKVQWNVVDDNGEPWGMVPSSIIISYVMLCVCLRCCLV
jgi:hypothetical protein